MHQKWGVHGISFPEAVVYDARYAEPGVVFKAPGTSPDLASPEEGFALDEDAGGREDGTEALRKGYHGGIHIGEPSARSE